jgi:hypothetical protein
MKFEKGQRVVLKSPGRIEATVEGQIYGDPSVPEDQRTYHVIIPETRKRFPAKDIEPIPGDQIIRPGSREWDTELDRFLHAGQHMILHPEDPVARDLFIQSGHQLGRVITLPTKP